MRELKKRQYGKEKSKGKLAWAAKDVFSRKGYDAATTKAIAQKAGVNESLIQRYFKNKLGLLFALISELEKKIFIQLPYEPKENLEEELRAFLEFRVGFAKSEKKLFRLIFSRALVDKSVSDRMGQVSQNGIPNLMERLESLQKKGQIRHGLDLKIASMLVGGVSFSLSTMTNILGCLEDKASGEILEMAVKVLAKGLS